MPEEGTHRTSIHRTIGKNAIQKNSTNALSNTLAILVDAVRTCSLGQITHALLNAGGRYRRNM